MRLTACRLRGWCSRCSLLLPLSASLHAHACPVATQTPRVLGSRAQTLLEVLAARLVDIQEWWATGALQVGMNTSDSQLHFLSQCNSAERLCRCQFSRQLRVAVVMSDAPTFTLRPEVCCGLVQARGFGAAQVSHLVCVLFEPTEFRARLIEEIEG